MALATFALTVGLSFSVLSVSAASACKGLERDPCERKDCIWVESYTRKDGVDVRGHCKSRPSGSNGKNESKSVKSDHGERFDSGSKSRGSDHEEKFDSKSKPAKSSDKKKSESKKKEKSEKNSKQKSDSR